MEVEITREYIDHLKELIENDSRKEIKELTELLHPADIAEVMEDLNMDEARYLYLLHH